MEEAREAQQQRQCKLSAAERVSCGERNCRLPWHAVSERPDLRKQLKLCHPSSHLDIIWTLRSKHFHVHRKMTSARNRFLSLVSQARKSEEHQTNIFRYVKMSIFSRCECVGDIFTEIFHIWSPHLNFLIQLHNIRLFDSLFSDYFSPSHVTALNISWSFTCQKLHTRTRDTDSIGCSAFHTSTDVANVNTSLSRSMCT